MNDFPSNFGSQIVDGGEALLLALMENNIDMVFGLPGVQMYPFFDALKRHSDKVQTIGARHEQTTAWMAFGAANSTGKPAAYSVVPGPGVLNAGSAVCTALARNMPIMGITGQVPSSFLGKWRGHLHELPDQLATMQTYMKWAGHALDANVAVNVVNDGFQQMISGRQGPVAIEMCWDKMAMKSTAPINLSGPAARLPTPEIDPDAISEAVKLIQSAKNPMIMVGTGARDADIEILELAKMLGAGVSAHRGGRGIVPEDHELGMISLAAKQLWKQTDLVIGVGTRLEMPFMRWTDSRMMEEARSADPKVIRIDIDPEEQKRFSADIDILADAKEGVQALIDAASAKVSPNNDIVDKIAAAKAKAREKVLTITPHIHYLDVIRANLPRDGFLVEEVCQAGFCSFIGFEVQRNRSWVTSGFQGNLGFGFPTSLGVKAANPDKTVISINGDGGFMYAMPELATAVQYGLNVIIIVFNNRAFGNVRRDQQTLYEGRDHASELYNPDFKKLADSFGIRYYSVETPEGLQTPLKEAVAKDELSLIEITIDRDAEVSPWTLILGEPE